MSSGPKVNAFTVAPPYPWFAHCHCSLCRKQHGSLFGSSLGVARSAFRWLQGAAEIVHYRFTQAFDRPFCRHCGAAAPAADLGSLTVNESRAFCSPPTVTYTA